jgi:hypothetical protein
LISNTHQNGAISDKNESTSGGKMKKWVIILLSLVLILSACAEKKSLQVHITEIIDAETGELVHADVYANGELVAKGVTTDTFILNLPGTFEVHHPDYEIWHVGIKDTNTEKTFSGPVRLVRKPATENY